MKNLGVVGHDCHGASVYTVMYRHTSMKHFIVLVVLRDMTVQTKRMSPYDGIVISMIIQVVRIRMCHSARGSGDPSLSHHLKSWHPGCTRSYLLIPSTYWVDTMLYDEHYMCMVIPAIDSTSLHMLTISKHEKFVLSMYFVCTDYVYHVYQWIYNISGFFSKDAGFFSNFFFGFKV